MLLESSLKVLEDYKPVICSENPTYFYSALLTFLNKSSIFVKLSFFTSNFIIYLIRLFRVVKYALVNRHNRR